LRGNFLDFYIENKDRIGQNEFFETLLANREKLFEDDKKEKIAVNNATLSDRITVYSIYAFYLAPRPGLPSRYQELVQYVQAYFSGDTGAIAKYEGSYTSLFSNSDFQIAVAAPQTYAPGAKAQDIGLVSGPTTATSLKNIITRYDERYDYIRSTEARKAAAQSILNYWTTILSLGTESTKAQEMAKPIYSRSLSYIDTANTRSPTYPFTNEFLKESVNYREVKQTYDDAVSEFTKALEGQYRVEITEFINLWPNMQIILPNFPTPPISHITEMSKYYEYVHGKTASGTDGVGITQAVTEVILNSTYTSLGLGTARATFEKLQKFVKDLKLFMQSQDYMRCILADTAARDKGDPIK
jgi:hypothetical protein